MSALQSDLLTGTLRPATVVDLGVRCQAHGPKYCSLILEHNFATFLGPALENNYTLPIIVSPRDNR